MTLNTILLIDDEPDILEITEIALSKVGGFNVRSYTNCLTAIEEVTSIMPDLILLDMMMPNINGLQALQKIRNIEQVAHIPVIFMTAKVQNSEVASYIDAGAIGVIRKPFDPMKLPDEIRKLWNGRGKRDV
jgi:CheY-like chemotaxis protein